jgi:hypothetical protein
MRGTKAERKSRDTEKQTNNVGGGEKEIRRQKEVEM